MDVQDMYRILLAEAVEKGDVDFTERVFKNCAQHNFDAKEMLALIIKTHLLEIAKNPNLTTTKHFIKFCLEIAKKNFIATNMPALLISDVIDTTPVDKCKDYFFALLEENIDTWRDTFFTKSRSVLLRLCNKLLNRLSTVEHANLRGKILIFLAIILPFYERSGCNVDNEYNTDYLEVKSDSSFDTINNLTKNPSFENFKLLQKYLRDPDTCITEEHWDKFLSSATGVLTFFSNNDVKEAQDSVTEPPISEKVQYTNDFLQLSVYTCKFRRQILVQMLMIYQYLNTKGLNKAQRQAIQTNTTTVYEILENTQPDGKKFLTSIKKNLESEKRWSGWKSAGCPEPPKPEKTKISFANLPKKRYFGDIMKEKMMQNKYSPESAPTNSLDHCMAESRNFLPTLTKYLHKAAEELKPECTIPEQNKMIYNGNFGWRALRLIAKRSNRFYDCIKEPMAKRSEFLKMMILKVLDAEQDNAEVKDDDLSDTASSIKISITGAQFEALFETLGDDWKLLAKKLGFTDSQIESIDVPNPTPLRRASSIFRSWFEGPNDPSIEHFCTVVDSIGHPEISKLMRIKCLGYDSHDTIEKHEREIEEKLRLLHVQDTSDSPKSLMGDDDDPSASVSADTDTTA